VSGPAPAERLRLLRPGPLTWEQGLEHALHGVRLALDMGVACHHRVLGAGPHLHPVAFARHELGLAEHVVLDADGSLEDELGRADVLVDAAVTDRASTAPVRLARARGVAFVATARPGLAAEGGILVARRDPSAIARALASLAGEGRAAA
jgi:hypothetical protein